MDNVSPASTGWYYIAIYICRLLPRAEATPRSDHSNIIISHGLGPRTCAPRRRRRSRQGLAAATSGAARAGVPAAVPGAHQPDAAAGRRAPRPVTRRHRPPHSLQRAGPGTPPGVRLRLRA
jgi:hypothetical protein